MSALLDVGERFGKLEVREPVTLYRCRCMRCGSDSVLATEDALLTGKVSQCFDCAAQSRLTPEQRVVIAFRRSLNMSPERILDYA